MGTKFDVVQRMAAASVESRWDDVAACVTEDVKAWSPTYELEGRDAWRRAIQEQNSPFGDIQQQHRLLAEDETQVITEGTWSIPHPSATGRAVLKFIAVHEFRGELIANLRQYFDMASFLASIDGSSNG